MPRDRQAELEVLIASVADAGVKQALIDNKTKLLEEKLTTAEDLQDVTDAQLKDIGIALGDRNKIKKKFQSAGVAGQDNRMTSLAAALESADFVGNPNDGLGGRRVYATRDQLVDELLYLARTKGAVLLKGPLGCGKTSTLQLLYWTAQKLVRIGTYSRVVYLKATDCTTHESWDDFVFNSLRKGDPSSTVTWADLIRVDPTNPKANVLVLIDELHTLYDKDIRLCKTLWASFKSLQQSAKQREGSDGSRVPEDESGNSSGVNIIATAMFGDSPSASPLSAMGKTNPTPFNLSEGQRVSLYRTDQMHLSLLLSDSEYSQLFDSTWQRQGYPPELLDLLFVDNDSKEAILEVTNGYAGAVVSILDRLCSEISKLRNSSKSGLLNAVIANCQKAGVGVGDMLLRKLFNTGAIYTALRGTRSFLKLTKIDDQALSMWELMQPLIKSGNEGVSMAELENSGLTDLAYQLEESGVLHVYEDEQGQDRYRLHTTLHMYYYQYQLAKCQPSRINAQQPKSFKMLLLTAIHRMSASRLATTKLKGVHDKVEEKKFQSEVILAVTSCLPKGWNMCPEVTGKHAKVRNMTYEEKSLGFMISGPSFKPMWALELLRDGYGVKDHEDRFETGGSYADFGWTDYAVVDFRSFPYTPPRLRKAQPNTCFVLFKNAEYTAATVLHASSGTEWEIQLQE